MPKLRQTKAQKEHNEDLAAAVVNEFVIHVSKNRRGRSGLYVSIEKVSIVIDSARKALKQTERHLASLDRLLRSVR